MNVRQTLPLISFMFLLSSLLFYYNFEFKSDASKVGLKNIKCDANIKSNVIVKSTNSTKTNELNLDLHLALAFLDNEFGVAKIKGTITSKDNVYVVDRNSYFHYHDEDSLVSFSQVQHSTGVDDTYPLKSNPHTPFIGVIGINQTYYFRYVNNSTILFNNFYVSNFFCNVVD